MSESEGSRLISGCRELGIALPAAAVPRLIAYLDLVYIWNASAGLTTVPRAHAARLHLVDSLLYAGDLDGARTIADIGTGGGLPGVPLALFLPQASVTLVESRRRKCSFLREAIRELSLRNCEVLECDARDLAKSGRRFAAVISRAFAPPVEWIPLAAPLAEPGGRVLVASGSDPAPVSIAAIGRAAGLNEPTFRSARLPGGGEARAFYRFDAPAK